MKYQKNQKDLRGRKKDRAIQKNTERKLRQAAKKFAESQRDIEPEIANVIGNDIFEIL